MTQGEKRPPLTGPQVALVAGAVGLACRWGEASARGRPHVREDMISGCLAALVDAARTYDPDAGPFGVHVRWHLRAAVKEVRRRSRPLGYRKAGPAPTISSLSEPSVRARAEPAVEHRGFDEVDAVDLVETVLPRLPAQHYVVCSLIYWSNLSQREVADLLGVTPRHVSRLHEDAIKILRDALGSVPRPLPMAAVTMAEAGYALARARESLGWSRHELAASCGIPPETLSRYERGLQSPHEDDIARIAEALGDAGRAYLGLVGDPRTD